MCRDKYVHEMYGQIVCIFFVHAHVRQLKYHCTIMHVPRPTDCYIVHVHVHVRQIFAESKHTCNVPCMRKRAKKMAGASMEPTAAQ